MITLCSRPQLVYVQRMETNTAGWVGDYLDLVSQGIGLLLSLQVPLMSRTAERLITGF